jgi:hypothetical protein
MPCALACFSGLAASSSSSSLMFELRRPGEIRPRSPSRGNPSKYICLRFVVKALLLNEYFSDMALCAGDPGL